MALDIQRVLIGVGAVKENDHRVLHRRSSDEGRQPTTLQQERSNQDDDDDWD